MNKTDVYQNISIYLSLGYLYLLLLGIIKDAVFFGFIGINIISYSSITDIMLSPLVVLCSHIILPITILGIVCIVYLIVTVSPKVHRKYRDRKWYKKLFNIEQLDEKYAKDTNFNSLIFPIAFGIFSFYFGAGIGGGNKISKRLENNELKIKHQITFIDNEKQDVSIIGENSLYVFYVIKGEDNVSISPIQGNIKRIKKLKK